MAITLALAGDTMLGRGVAEMLRVLSPRRLVAPEVVGMARRADLFVLNLECCISERGAPWPAPEKVFHFRAPPVAVEALVELGVDCVTLANNHALDYGPTALLDTFRHLDDAGIVHVGAGPELGLAREPVVLDARGFRLAVVALTDHPWDFAAERGRPGVAYADLRAGVLPRWLRDTLATARDRADAVLVTPHWGPNMRAAPVPHVRAVAPALLAAGASLVAGHSAHVFQGVAPGVLFDLGDFLDDYATDPILRNDLGLLWLVTLEADGPTRIEAIPLELEYCHTRLATGANLAWIRRRVREACRPFGTLLDDLPDRLRLRPGVAPGAEPRPPRE